MRIAKVLFLAVCLSLGALAISAEAQDLHPSRRLSPLGMARGFAGAAYVKVTFSQPYKRGRDHIFGEKGGEALHAYGDVWRFGANEPTEITFSAPVMFGGQHVEAGTYSIFATPGASSWTLHLNDLRGGGANEYDAEKNVTEVSVNVTRSAEEVDQFTITLDEENGGLSMKAVWLDWQIAVPIRGM